MQFVTDTILRLDHQGNVKVGDFGLAEDMYATGYVREESKSVKLPYKWMPPESLEDGLFSEHSDVVCMSCYYLTSVLKSTQYSSHELYSTGQRTYLSFTM